VKKTIIARATALAVLAGVLISGVTSAEAALRVPKAAWPACSVSPGTYCVDQVILTDARGHKIQLVWVPNGQAVPQAPVNDGPIMAPLFVVDKAGKVNNNNWWESAPNRDVLLSGTATFQDASALVGTANFPEVGAKFDPTTKKWDTTLPLESWSQQINCWDNKAQKQIQATRAECFKAVVLTIQDNQVKWWWSFTDPAQAANHLNYVRSAVFVDGQDLAKQNLQAAWGSTYDSKTKTFSKTEPLSIPQWVNDNYIQAGWNVIGMPPVAGAAPAPSDTATASIPDTATVADQTVVAGSRIFSGRWTSPNWNALGLNAMGYDGLYIDAKAANEFVNHVFVDVLPALVDNNNKSALAAQAASKIYATNLDPDVTISVKVRTGDIKTGVTVAVGVDSEVTTGRDQYGSNLTIVGNPVSVPVAKSAKDCTGEDGVAVANVRQFQTLIVVQNDTAGFGVDGTSGNMLVASNGVCGLSTPIWNADEKSFSWTTAAPHFAADGTTQNKGFYKAVIPFKDAAVLWGLTNPADAATALTVSVSTEAGGSEAALNVVSAKNGNIVIDVSGFGYSKPKLSIRIKNGYKPSKKSISSLPVAKKTVTCVLGKTTKKVTGATPKCPSGYKKIA
jgi:hypothetical protein